MNKITNRDSRLYNEDLAPTPESQKNWGWFEIFNVWANDVQSLFGYALATSLFLTFGLNGWAVFAAIILAGIFVMFLVNLSGKPCVENGIPYPVFARVSMGVFGANFPAMLRGVVAIFWYGAQTYFASTAVSLLINSLLGLSGDAATFMGLTFVDWIALIFVGIFQVYLFWKGIDQIRRFLNFAGPVVYAIMILLMVVIWYQAGGDLLSEAGTIFSGTGDYEGGAIAAFIAIFGTMVAYFAAVVINFGDFARFVKDEQQMRKGNLFGLVGNLILFSFIALIITAGTVVIFGEAITNPTDIVDKVDNLALSLIAAFAFFTATVGINMVANFIPPAYDLANLMPSKIDFKKGGLITAIAGFILAILWVSVISQVGLFPFVNTLGAILAPVYGIMIADYYVIKGQKLDVEQLYTADPNGIYYYNGGWNKTAIIAMLVSGVFAVGTVWLPALADLNGGYSWVIGATLGAVLYIILSKKTNK